MNGIKYLLDTCFIIRWHGQQADALGIIQQLDMQLSECAYSDISHAEIFSWHGLNQTDEQGLKYLLADLPRLAVSNRVIDDTIRIRRKHKIKLPDALILATAKTYRLQLVTLDDKLQRIEKLEAERQ
ncbi:PIN domain-containing protein [Faucicola atlantae]|uniref:PIN domain-containing protein n=1 Tax=Faucicola atlantae TaxID=34059 RepID=UPI0025B076C0|nr:PIN domain-containing protein [Moraxella atlantae]